MNYYETIAKKAGLFIDEHYPKCNRAIKGAWK